MTEKQLLRVADFCGEEPHLMGKNEAARLLAALEPRLDPPGQPVRLDFAAVAGVSASGARVLFFGLFRRFGAAVLDRLSFSNVQPELTSVLESAVEDAIGHHAGT